MIRKFNYTNRLKIKRTDLRVSVVQDNGRPSLEADFLVDQYPELPADAAVYIEAYHRTKFDRFSFGTVGRLLPPDNRTLKSFSSADMQDIRFRVKVVDESETHGQILALAEGVSAVSDDERNANRLSLLGVDPVDLGNRIWELDLENDEIPWLLVNSNIPDIQILLQRDDMFFCSVYPAIVRQILEYILFYCDEDYTSEPEEDEDSTYWQYRWLCFGKNLSGEKWPKKHNADVTIRKEWIESCVEHFCRKQRVLQKTSALLGG